VRAFPLVLDARIVRRRPRDRLSVIEDFDFVRLDGQHSEYGRTRFVAPHAYDAETVNSGSRSITGSAGSKVSLLAQRRRPGLCAVYARKWIPIRCDVGSGRVETSSADASQHALTHGILHSYAALDSAPRDRLYRVVPTPDSIIATIQDHAREAGMHAAGLLPSSWLTND
jgi:hypothetical protein